jgi:hypothetical protein
MPKFGGGSRVGSVAELGSRVVGRLATGPLPPQPIKAKKSKKTAIAVAYVRRIYFLPLVINEQTNLRVAEED